MNASVYPVRVNASLDSRLSRWLWLVKWLLAIPHFVVLVFLWVAFVVLSIIAFFAILFTGRYPRSVFDFNVGVLRWSWRVTYYTYGALGTDRYPPFTLQDVLEYPARFEIDYPQRLSRGLVLVKWWLLAIPHYLVVAFFVGSGPHVASATSSADEPWLWGGGLIGLLVLVAAIVLLFTGNYPRSIFDLVLGMNRWALRVTAYAALMTDDYPPFRLDMGPDEPGPGHLAVPPRTPATAPPADAEAVMPTTGPQAPPGEATTPRPWTAGRAVLVVLGSILVLTSIGLGTGGAALAIADKGFRNDEGFFMSRTDTLNSPGYAIASDTVNLRFSDVGPFTPERLLGDAKLTATSGPSEPVFVGIGHSSDVQSYLGDVAHSTLIDYQAGGGGPQYRQDPGGAPGARPGQTDIWVASSSGTGEQSVVWPVESGDWTAVVMNADGSRTVTADVSAGATLPGIGWAIGVLLIVAVVLLLVGITLLLFALRRHTAKQAQNST